MSVIVIFRQSLQPLAVHLFNGISHFAVNRFLMLGFVSASPLSAVLSSMSLIIMAGLFPIRSRLS